MSAIERFDEYMDYLSGGLGHLDRHAGLKGYCTGLMLPLARKSVEPMAARVDPLYASARHQVSGIRHYISSWPRPSIERHVPAVPKDYVSPESVLRAQRHVTRSIATLRLNLGSAPIARLG